MPGLLERHTRHRTAHAALIAEILSLLAGRTSSPPPAGTQPLLEALSDSEIRVLRYLPTNLSAPEIASELFVSPNTVKTHVRNLYAKLAPTAGPTPSSAAATWACWRPLPTAASAPALIPLAGTSPPPGEVPADAAAVTPASVRKIKNISPNVRAAPRRPHPLSRSGPAARGRGAPAGRDQVMAICGDAPSQDVVQETLQDRLAGRIVRGEEEVRHLGVVGGEAELLEGAAPQRSG